MVAMALESDARKTSSAHSSINSFLKTRRDSAGCALVFALMELEIALPDEAFYHPYVRDLIVIIQDISVMANVSAVNHSYFPPPCLSAPITSKSLSLIVERRSSHLRTCSPIAGNKHVAAPKTTSSRS